MKKYKLIENEKYKLMLRLEENEFDYYTDVYIELTFDENTIILFNDNLLALKNSMEQFNENIPVLETNLSETKLGILLNDYYRGLYENDFKETITLDYQEQWVGEKYCWFINSEYATWIYQYGGNVIMKVTPVFCGFEEDNYVQKYSKFNQEYKDIFREQVSLQQLIFMKQLIFNLYNKLF